MLDIFSGRNRTLTNLIKLGTYLGRSLRENVQLFTVDSVNEQVCYLTESGNFISGKYNILDGLSLKDIKVQSSEIISNENMFDEYVNEQVSAFVKNIGSNNFASADIKFSDILSLWEERFKLKHMQKLIAEKTGYDKGKSDMLGTQEFSNFSEISPIISKYINENYQTFFDSDLVNSIKKIKIASSALNLNKISYSNLLESGEYTVREICNVNVYEALCQSELIRKELLEARRNFEYAWANTDKIIALSRMINEKDDSAVELALVEAITEVPFLAMASKGQIASVIENNLIVENVKVYKTKQIKEFASRLFEMKKPVRTVLNKLLSEKYNINVLNLKEPVSMSSLIEDCANTFSLMAERAKNNNIIKSVCEGMAEMLKTKSGVEIVDINNALCDVIEEAGINIIVPDFKLTEEFDFSNVFNKDFDAKEVIKGIKEKLTSISVTEKVEEKPEKVDSEKEPEEGKKKDDDKIPEGDDESEKIKEAQRKDFIKKLKMIDDVFKDLVGPEKPEEKNEEE